MKPGIEKQLFGRRVDPRIYSWLSELKIGAISLGQVQSISHKLYAYLHVTWFPALTKQPDIIQAYWNLSTGKEIKEDYIGPT